MSWPRGLARRFLAGVDIAYRRRHRLRAVGPLLYVARARYPGPSITFRDGTRLVPGDDYGALHFDNSRIAALGEGSRIRNGVRFARLLLDSFGQLAEASRHDAALRDLPVFHGITWIGEHGAGIGFVSEPLPAGPRRRLLGAHFRILKWVFAPSLSTAVTDAPEPRQFWLTRSDLIENFGQGRR